MSVRVVNTSSGTIKVSTSSTPTINVSKSSQVVKVNSSSPGSVKVSLSESPIKVSSQVSPEIKVSSPSVSAVKVTGVVPALSSSSPGGSSTLSSAISVTNEIGAATNGEQFQAGTNLETIITEMLAPYKSPAITNFSVSWVGGLGIEDYISGSAVPLGESPTVSQVSVTFSDVSNLDSGTNVIVKYNNTTIATKSSSDHSNGVFTFSSINHQASAKSSIGTDVIYVYYTHTSPTIGTDAGATLTESSSHVVYHQKPCILYTSASISNSNMSSFISGATKVSSDLKLNLSVSGDREVNLSCDNSSIDENSNYVWLQIPEGVTIEDISIYTGANRGTWDATESFSLLGDGLSHTVGAATYNVDMYRSNQQRPLNRKHKLDLNVSS